MPNIYRSVEVFEAISNQTYMKISFFLLNVFFLFEKKRFDFIQSHFKSTVKRKKKVLIYFNIKINAHGFV